MGCGGSKSTAVGQNEDRSPLMEPASRDEPKTKETEQEGVGESHGTFKLPCCQLLVSKEKFRPGRVGEIKQKISPKAWFGQF